MTITNDTKLLADECARLNKIIKQNEDKIENFKKELKKRMLEEKISLIEGEDYKIRHTKYNNKYSSVLAEGFSNLGAEIISNLIRENLISVSYKLNTDEYIKKIKKEGESLVTPFVKQRATTSFIAIRNN